MRIIKIKRGLNGFKYSAWTNTGGFIGNFNKLSDIREHWKIEIKSGLVVLVRELGELPE